MAVGEFSNQDGDWQDEVPGTARARWLDATLGELKTSPMLRVSPQTTVEEAARLMSERGETAAIITDGEELLGVFSERDALKQMLSGPECFALPMSQVMTAHPQAFTESTTLACALRDLALDHHQHIPVLDAVGRPTALLSARGLVQFIIHTFRNEILNDSLERETACTRASGDWPSLTGGESMD